MFCTECGAKLQEGVKFCPECGQSAKRYTAPPPEPTPVVQPTPVIITPVPEVQPMEPMVEPVTPVEPAAPVYTMAEEPVPVAPVSPEPVYTPPVEPEVAPSAPVVDRTWDNTKQKRQPKKRSGCFTAFLVLAAIMGVIILGIVGLLILGVFWAFEDETKEGEAGYTLSSGNYDTTIVSNLSSTELRDYYTTIKGDGTDEVTLMVYLLGSDLESDGGYASTDLEEMLDATMGDNFNLVVMTGGSTRWSNPSISSSTCQYWLVDDGKLLSIDDNLGKLDMTSATTLTNFVTDMTSLYPANRYGLILWDHGGGTLSGYGYDELYPSGELSLEDLSHALAATGVKFDFVGFDACLMGSLESAIMLEPYADYMIASEEWEEATGWYYTEFLEAWSADTSMATLDMATLLIDSFVEASVAEYRRAEATLSVVDLREIPAVYQIYSDYFDDLDVSSDQSAYTLLSAALSQAKAFGEGDYEQFDIIDFVSLLGLDGTEDLIGAVNSAVKYSACSDSVSNAYGLSMYFPYDYPEYYAETCATMEAIGYEESYITFLNQYVSASAGDYYQYTNSGGGSSFSGGQSSGSGSSGAQGGSSGSQGGNSGPGSQQGPGWGQDSGGNYQDWSAESWYDSDTASSYADWYDDSTYSDLEIVLRGDEYVLQLSDAQWEDIVTIELQVLLDDGNGYIDLGSDNVYEFDRNGDLIIAFDYTWVTLDGHTVPFYAEEEIYNSDRDWFTYGIVPALLNGTTYVEVVVCWDDEEPYGYVTGYRKYTATREPVGKGTFAFSKGDTLEFLFDYYSYDGEYVGTCQFGSTYTYNGRDIEVSYDYVGNYDAIAYFQLTDIYNHIYTSESVYYTD